MKEKQTPLMRQYSQIKNKYPETILLFRLGDFFETFNDDALITAKVCGIALTKRNNGAAGEMPLAGFPHHQLDAYLPKIVKAGYRVAVCEQLEDPKQARGIVRRGVTEVVTPGVALYEKLLDTKKNNYLAAVSQHQKRGREVAAIAACDISTGEFFVSEVNPARISEVIETLNPSEIVFSKAQKNEIPDLIEELSYEPAITKMEEWIFEPNFGRETLLRHFKTKNLKGFGIDDKDASITAAGAVLHYINETQKSSLPQIKKISIFDPSEYMTLDHATRRNLEITYSFFEGSQEGSLISILDKTETAMGGRLLKKWITMPLRRIKQIKRRLEAVRALFNNDGKRSDLRMILSDISDLERLISKVGTGRANPRELVSLKNSIAKFPDIKDLLKEFLSESLLDVSEKLSTLDELKSLIQKALVDEPSTTVGGGNVFRQGYSEELDGYVEAKTSGKDWIKEYQEKQKEVTGIQSLKVGFNNVFGYYLDVTKTHVKKVPDNYQRKQTLRNSERYTTNELKEFENKILTAEENLSILEQKLFNELREKVASFTEEIQFNAKLIASIDCLQSYAQVSSEHSYVEPEIDESEIIDISDGRHPVVEQLLPMGDSFTPNSTKLDTEEEQIHIITGPNMSGKSCYLRQVALIVLMGQIGCFVPAKSAKFGIVDRIFTRVGAQDNITAGESTFLVEMQEAANIMNNATSKSLILLDEIGRGTATYDGISIAWSICEYLHNNIGAKTLFATHYHELNDLADRYVRIKNYQVEVIEAGSTILFAHKVKPGGSDHSFGIYVAQMAGLPADIIDRANEILGSLESGGKENKTDNLPVSKADVSSIDTQEEKKEAGQLAIFEFRDDPLRDQLKNIDVNKLTPVQALQVLADLNKAAKKKNK